MSSDNGCCNILDPSSIQASLSRFSVIVSVDVLNWLAIISSSLNDVIGHSENLIAVDEQRGKSTTRKSL